MLSVKVFQDFEGRGRDGGRGLNELDGQESLWNIISGGLEYTRRSFCLFWFQWLLLKCMKMKICLYKNKVVIYEKWGKCWNNVKAIFSNAMLWCHPFFYLHYFTFLAITFEMYNNIDSKTKALFALTKSFKIWNLLTKILLLSEKN